MLIKNSFQTLTYNIGKVSPNHIRTTTDSSISYETKLLKIKITDVFMLTTCLQLRVNLKDV